MNLNDYPTPRTTAARGYEDSSGCWRCRENGDYVCAEASEQLEREAAAWRDVARMHRTASTREEVQAADEAFDRLLTETQTP